MAHTDDTQTELRSDRGGPASTAPGPQVLPQFESAASGAAAGSPAAVVTRPRSRLYAIDGLRLLAALMVGVHHYIGTFRVNEPDSSPWGRPVEQLFPLAFPVAAYGWIGVQMFFVISGFVICMSSWGRRPRDFFVSRVIRLYPAYWFGVLLTTAVLTVWPQVFEPLPHAQALLNLSMLQGGMNVRDADSAYWTLWSELRFYLVFLLVIAGGLTYRKVVVFCCIWGALAAVAPESHLPLLVTVVDPTAAWYFIAGLALFLMHRFGQDMLLWGILGMSWAVGQYQLIDRIKHESVSSWKGAAVIYTVFLIVMVVIALGRLDWVRGKWLAVAGSLTYPFYLIHYSIGLTAIDLLHDRVNAGLLVAGLIAAMLVAGWFIHLLVERPVSRVLKKGLTGAFARLDAQ